MPVSSAVLQELCLAVEPFVLFVFEQQEPHFAV